MPSLAELLDVRAKGLEQERNTPKPVPLREHRDYAKYFKWLEEGKFTLGELSTQLLHAGLDNRALEMDPSKPYGWQPSDDEEKRPAWAPPPGSGAAPGTWRPAAPGRLLHLVGGGHAFRAHLGADALGQGT